MSILKNPFRKDRKARLTPVTTTHTPLLDTDLLSAARVNYILRAARSGSPQQLFTLYQEMILSDSHLQGEMSKRKLSVLADKFTIQPADQKSAADKQTAELISDQVHAIKNWRIACGHLLDGTLYPVAVMEKVYRPSGETPLRYKLDELVPVPYHLLDYTQGYLRIRITKEDGEPIDEYIDPDPERYIIHRGHLLNTPDYFGGPFRSLVWWWLLSCFSRDWWGQFLERYGAPFVVGKYNTANPDDRNILATALDLAVAVKGLIISESTEIELKEASQQSGDGYEKFIELCNREKSKLIVGQTLSSSSESTGLGSGVANLHSDVRDDLRRFDSILLCDTLRDQLFTQLCHINNLKGVPPSLTWGTKSPQELEQMADTLTKLHSAGLEVDDAGIQTITDEIGIPLRRKQQVDPIPFSVAGEGGARPFRRYILH
jgi:phage gp29-like protein